MTTSYDYFPAAMLAIEYISQGMTRTIACDYAGVSIPAFEKYIASSEELQQLLEEAERRSYDAMVDALANIHNHRIYGQADPKMARVISDNLKWLVEKRDRKRYGPKVEVNHTHTLDKAIIAALNAGRQRAALASGPVIEGELTEVASLPAPDEDDDLDWMN